MNILDLVLLAFMALAAWTGFRFGLLARSVSWIGLGVGLVLGSFAVPWTLRTFARDAGANSRLLTGLLTLMLCVTVVSVLADAIGLRIRRAVRRTAFGPVDRVAGGLVGAGSVLLVVWFLLPAAANTPGSIARSVRDSAVVGFVEDVAPDPPAAARALARIVDESGFPTVFADLQPAPVVGPPPSQIPVPQDVVARVTASTVNVEAFGCGNGFEGSGFVVAPGLVATNAHVVAGADDVDLRRPDGQVVDGVVVHVDDARDLALIESDVGREPLRLAQPQLDSEGASIGYPAGQNEPRVAPVGIRDERETIGYDIRHEERVTRRVLFLAARLQQGDSGSPVVDTTGAVVGVVFAVSPDDPDTAYALAVEELREALQAQRRASTGACLR